MSFLLHSFITNTKQYTQSNSNSTILNSNSNSNSTQTTEVFNNTSGKLIVSITNQDNSKQGKFQLVQEYLMHYDQEALIERCIMLSQENSDLIQKIESLKTDLLFCDKTKEIHEFSLLSLIKYVIKVHPIPILSATLAFFSFIYILIECTYYSAKKKFSRQRRIYSA